MQVYRGMDIGTAKPSRDILERIPHHMIDVVDPDDDYDVRRFQTDASRILATAATEQRRLVISGGSGLHFRALVDPMTFAPTDPTIRSELETVATEDLRTALSAIDPGAVDVVDMANRRRLVRAIEVHRLTGETPTHRHFSPEAEALRSYEPKVDHMSLGFDAGEKAHDRATVRFGSMVEAGLVGEVTAMSARLGRSASQAVGYKELLPVISGSETLEAGTEAALGATRRLVKRQRTYFRRDPRIRWMPWQDDEEKRIADAVALIEKEAKWTS
jgi:tRNA dimethylallyltransferase